MLYLKKTKKNNSLPNNKNYVTFSNRNDHYDFSITYFGLCILFFIFIYIIHFLHNYIQVRET